jgi:hypothetical protein
MRRKAASSAVVGAVLVLFFLAGCSSSSQKAGGADATTQATRQAYAPRIDPADFTTKVDNQYFPLKPGTTLLYRGKTKDGTQGDVMTVTHHTKRIMGVACVVVDDEVTEGGGKPVERTLDWYAQDKRGNVWYFGEDTKEYENGKVKSTAGSWEAGKDGAEPGIIMPARPKVGQSYRQEYYEGKAEDMARVVDLNGSAKVPYGSFERVLVTEEWTPLEPGVAARKYYAAGVGDIMEVGVKGPPETLQLVGVKSTG